MVDRIKLKVREGCLFEVKNFKVVANVGQYKPLVNENKIVFVAITTITPLQEGNIAIPINGFQFIKSEIVDSRVDNNSVLSDIVGRLCAIGEIEVVGTGAKKRDIKVLTDYSEIARITLWGELGEKFDPNLYNKDAGPFIVIVTSTTIKKFQGNVNFASTSATKIYMNLKIDYVKSLMDKFSTMSSEVKSIESSHVKRTNPEEEMFENRMTIADLFDTNWNSEIKEYVVTVRALITGIDNFFGWYYVACKKCRKKVKTENGIYKCVPCNENIQFPFVMYKIHIRVKDENSKSIFVLFNDVAESLLDTSPNKLLNRLSSDTEVPKEIEELCGQEYIFKLKLTHYNTVHGYENFTVSKVFKPSEELEEDFKHKKMDEGKEDGVRKRKRRNMVIVDDEDQDGDTT